MQQTINTKKSERGNVLFLILIAVALFAALSYVVTQSTRSGGGSTEREQNILSSAQMTQYPTALRTALIRMILSGVAVEALAFNAPGDFTGVSSPTYLVFGPQGGGAVFQAAPADLMSNNLPGVWYYNAQFEVPGIGQSGAGGNDIIAFLVGINSGVCKQVNDELGISTTSCGSGTLQAGVPIVTNSVTGITTQMEDGYTFPVADQVDIQGTCTDIFLRQASGCFYHATGPSGPAYIFYSVLLER